MNDALWQRIKGTFAVIVMGALLLYGVWPWLPVRAHATAPRTVVFYGFSILDHSITRDIFPEFRRRWSAARHENVEMISSFAGSGTVTNQIIMGVPVEIALLALEADAERLATAGVVPPRSWRRLPHDGVVNRTPIVILVRPGNPKKIHDFADLTRPGIGVVHPDPLTSGAANWAIAAEYGAGLRAHPEDPDAGYRMLLGIWKNVVAQAASARSARTQFDLGFGDALITYEQEGLWDRARDKLHGEIVYPRHTILTEHTLVIMDRRVPARDRALLDSLAAYLWSESAQRAFVHNGFRSVNEDLVRADSAFGQIEDPFFIGDLGGWTHARTEIVEKVWRDRVLKEIDR